MVLLHKGHSKLSDLNIPSKIYVDGVASQSDQTALHATVSRFNSGIQALSAYEGVVGAANWLSRAVNGAQHYCAISLLPDALPRGATDTKDGNRATSH